MEIKLSLINLNWSYYISEMPYSCSLASDKSEVPIKYRLLRFKEVSESVWNEQTRKEQTRQNKRESGPIVIRTCWFPLEHFHTSRTVAMEIWPKLPLIHLRNDEYSPEMSWFTSGHLFESDQCAKRRLQQAEVHFNPIKPTASFWYKNQDSQ